MQIGIDRGWAGLQWPLPHLVAGKRSEPSHPQCGANGRANSPPDCTPKYPKPDRMYFLLLEEECWSSCFRRSNWIQWKTTTRWALKNPQPLSGRLLHCGSVAIPICLKERHASGCQSRISTPFKAAIAGIIEREREIPRRRAGR